LISVIDSDAPGVGHWVEEPHAISNDEIVASYVNPDADFDGGPLTGLKTTYRVQGIASGGVHPFDGLSATDILVMEGQPGITIDKKVLDGSSPGQKEAIGWSATVDVTYGHAIFWSD
jgi:hypothetical protein